MNTKHYACFLVYLTVLASVTGFAAEGEVTGVFGLSPVLEDAALAVWVPLDSDESINGISWYNNDGNVAFPEILAVAGSSQYPSVLEQALVVGEDVSGMSPGWSEYIFTTPIASASPGLFVVFRLPEGADFLSEGEGAGVGYILGDGMIKSWVALGDGAWGRLSADYQMAVVPIMNTNKSGEIIVLNLDDQIGQEVEETDTPTLVVPGLTAIPNPFNPRTEISYSLPKDSFVKLAIFDLRGYNVKELVSQFLVAGTHSVDWNGRDSNDRAVASGVYLCQLKAGKLVMSQRITLIR
jgi:hypothetical protein|nr:hypothetical protein [Candidatus Krumholzibacteria bacterium]